MVQIELTIYYNKLVKNMFCSHCGYDLNENKQKAASKASDFRTAKTKITYVCPRCGHIIKEELNEEEIKSLSRASHAEIHRARNSVNTGLCLLTLGFIFDIIAFLFFLMSYKAALGGQLSLESTEFKVFIVLAILGLGLNAFGFTLFFKGKSKNKKYNQLLKDINNNVFVQ